MVVERSSKNPFVHKFSPFSGDIVAARALSQVGEGEYNIMTNNCEHFAKWCKYGARRSQQATSMLWVIPVLIAYFPSLHPRLRGRLHVPVLITGSVVSYMCVFSALTLYIINLEEAELECERYGLHSEAAEYRSRRKYMKGNIALMTF